MRIGWLSIVAFAVMAAVVGCGSGETSGSGTSTDASKSGDSGKKITMGFSQVGAESGWRKANTDSIKESADKAGIKLNFVDAQQKQENQIKEVKAFIAQGVDVIAFSPGVETGWQPVLEEAKKAKIPVILSDRRADVPDDLYETFIGGDFIKEGERVGEWLAKTTNGKAGIAEITGTVGSAPANDRHKGFSDTIKKFPGMKVVIDATGDFTRSGGKQVMEAFLKSDKASQITVVFAHNDDMALGAIQAMEEAGKKPGKDIIVVSIDGEKDMLQAIADGKANYCVECNPMLGPLVMQAAKDVIAGKKLDKRTVVPDEDFDAKSAAAKVSTRQY